MQQQKPIKVISLFSGCGGLDLGIESGFNYLGKHYKRTGFKVIWANDTNDFACATFRKNFPDAEAIKGSIADISPEAIPSGDLVIGGFPCQDFSVIWKRHGLNGSRGSLYKEFLRFVNAKKPLAFVAENVKGLLSANKGKAIKQIIEDFEAIEPGYLVKPKLYNFAEYGVPQFRQRVLIVGIRMDTGFDFHHPEPTHGPGRKFPYVTAGEALKDVERVPYNTKHMKIMPRTKEILKLISEGGNFTDIPKGNPLYVKGMISHVYRRINRKEPAKTIIAAGGGGTWGYHYPEPRALTNRERARLQSFPDDFVFEGSFTEVRRQIGNAVPPKGVWLLAKELLRLFRKEYIPIDLYKLNETYKKLTLKERLKIN